MQLTISAFKYPPNGQYTFTRCKMYAGVGIVYNSDNFTLQLMIHAKWNRDWTPRLNSRDKTTK